MNVREALLAMATLLDERGHCRRHLAVDARGRAVDPLDERAAAFCIVGAAIRVCGATELCVQALLAVRFALGDRTPDKATIGIAPVSDTLTKADAIALLRTVAASR